MQILLALNWFLITVICLVIAFVINEYYMCLVVVLAKFPSSVGACRPCRIEANTYAFFASCKPVVKPNEKTSDYGAYLGAGGTKQIGQLCKYVPLEY